MSEQVIERSIEQRRSEAEQLDQELKTTMSATNQMAWRQAQILAAILDRKLYVELGHQSFKSYVEDECSFKLRKAHQLVAVHRKFVCDLQIPPAEASELGISRAAMLIRMITSENSRSLIEAAKTKSVRELQRFLREGEQSAVAADEPVPVTALATELQTIVCKTNAPQSDWMRLISLRPDPAKFFVEEEVWEQMVYAASQCQNVLLRGPSGCGKTELITYVASALRKPLAAFNFGASSDPRAMLLGTTHLRAAKTFFAKSRFAQAFAEGNHCILLDEITRARPEAFNILLPVLDGQGYLDCDEVAGGERVLRGPNTNFFATANVGMAYTGTDEMDHALRDRQHVEVEMDFPNAKAECTVLTTRYPNLNDSDALKLVKIAKDQRKMFREGEFSTAISTRSLLAAAQQVAGGISLASAFKYCVASKFNAEGAVESEKQRIEQLFQKY